MKYITLDGKKLRVDNELLILDDVVSTTTTTTTVAPTTTTTTTTTEEPVIPETAFVTEWDIEEGLFELGTGDDNGWNWDYTIDWGDGSEWENITGATNPTHNYTSANSGCTISIWGSFPHLRNIDEFTNPINQNLMKVIKWGDVGFKSFRHAFYGMNDYPNITYPGLILPSGPITGISGATDYQSIFSGTRLDDSLDVNIFSGSTDAEDFSGAFEGDTIFFSFPSGIFDPSILPNVTNMEDLFRNNEEMSGEADPLWDWFSVSGGYSVNVSGTGAFANCGNLDNFGDIPSGWK